MGAKQPRVCRECFHRGSVGISTIIHAKRGLQKLMKGLLPLRALSYVDRHDNGLKEWTSQSLTTKCGNESNPYSRSRGPYARSNGVPSRHSIAQIKAALLSCRGQPNSVLKQDVRPWWFLRSCSRHIDAAQRLNALRNTVRCFLVQIRAFRLNEDFLFDSEFMSGSPLQTSTTVLLVVAADCHRP
jgi:hypothetical protein